MSNIPIPAISNKLLFGSLKEEILDVYRKLGGIEGTCAYRGKLDIVTDRFNIELDEQLHFNNYRLTTPKSPLYKAIKTFPLETYRMYCRKYKGNCLRAGSFGGKWTKIVVRKCLDPLNKRVV